MIKPKMRRAGEAERIRSQAGRGGCPPKKKVSLSRDSKDNTSSTENSWGVGCLWGFGVKRTRVTIEVSLCLSPRSYRVDSGDKSVKGGRRIKGIKPFLQEGR